MNGLRQSPACGVVRFTDKDEAFDWPVKKYEQIEGNNKPPILSVQPFQPNQNHD